MIKNEVVSADWMSRVSDDKRITEINIPGTHDSLARFVAFTIITRTQSASLEEQLGMGVRYFDFRFIKTARGLVAAHGGIRCKASGGIFAPEITADSVAQACIRFLKKHPTETVLFQLKEDKGGAGDSFYSEFYNTVIKGNADRWFAQNRIPTLGEVRGKIVLLRAVSVDKEAFDETNSGINFDSYPYIGSKKINDYRCGKIADLNGNGYEEMHVQDSYKLEMKKKWQAVKGFLEADLDKRNFNICLLSCTGIFQPYLNARFVNNEFMEYELRKKEYGIIAVDYVDHEICRKIYETNY